MTDATPSAARPSVLTTALSRRHALKLLAGGAVGGVLAGALPLTAPGSAAAPPVALGAYIPGAPADPARIDAFAKQIGRMPAIVSYFRHWGSTSFTIGKAFNPAFLESIAERGAMPLITWEPWVPGGGVDQPAYRLAAIARGDFDDYLRSWAVGLARYGRPVYLRFAHEMNGDWYPWCVGVNGNTAADYVAAWRHVHQLFVADGATKVRWVWSPNVAYGSSTPMAATYPGDASVDWVALDGYNWGTSQAGSSWRGFGTVFGASYDTLRALTAKPMMIAETASAEQGGDKAKWIEEAFQRQLPSAFPAVRAVVWFNEQKEADWRVDSSPRSLRAFRNAATSPYLQGGLP